MANDQTLAHLAARGLAPTVVSALSDIADWARGRGVSLLVFGSFATGDNQRGSDLDLAIPEGAALSADTRRELEIRIEDLPTVRPVDLVDLSAVSEAFRRAALRDARPL